MPPQLVALTEGPNIALDKPIVLIGRHQECDIQIPSRKISRRHCCVAQVHNYLVVRDLGSTNGVRVNGSRAIEGTLQPGDELTIGNLTYRVEWDDHRIAAGLPKAARPVPAHPLQSSDEPQALPDSPQDAQAPQAKPARPVKNRTNAIFEGLDLIPLDPSGT
jgi:pSer/pThr/pTyr-binding forkhead associated (FHA) protein